MTTPPEPPHAGELAKAEVLKLLSTGHTAKQVADQFGWPVRTIRKIEREGKRT